MWFLLPANAQTSATDKIISPVSIEPKGSLVYVVDSLGNRIPDFSFAGYKSGNEKIPDYPIRISLPAITGDATGYIQAAIDYVASLKPDNKGIRGAVLLQRGRFVVNGGLAITASGVVLRGSGMASNGTVLIGSGTDRQTLITIAGKNDQHRSSPVKITDPYIPVSSMSAHVSGDNSFKTGDDILIHRPSSKEWIEALGTAHFGGGITALGWKPGDQDLYFDRKIVSVKGGLVTFDAPLTTAIDSSFGGGSIIKCTWPGRIEQSGVEHMKLISSYDTANPKDEQHRWMAIVLENTSDAWVRQVEFHHFAGSAVAIRETAKRITVEDCKSLSPVSEIGGHRRYAFHTAGQQTVFQRCYSEYAYHDFSAGFGASLNAFVQCEGMLPFNFSGGIDSWASGILFDVVTIDGGALSFSNRGPDAQGAGWSTANSVFWQCAASTIENYKPPTANNWAIGCWAEFAGDGFWQSSNEHVKPRSLYYAQLAARRGDSVLKTAFLLPFEGEASSSPTVEVAVEQSRRSIQPAVTLKEWIDRAPERNPIPSISAANFRLPNVVTVVTAKSTSIKIQNGWLVNAKRVLAGGRIEQPWWRGNTRPDGVRESKPAVTRYVPGRSGAGLTDDLLAMTDSMAQRNQVLFEHNYGLWYDRRRDDHERVRRLTGEVWAPFYELPFARSGIGTAWDGLSKYDLTKYNNWYWNRLKLFADHADSKGLILFHQNYFQHNILEAGAHYADFPWRTANNINSTAFPEPVPYAGDKRIFMAEQFYDVRHEPRRTLHRLYIRKCLENFKDNNSVIQLTSAEFTGPRSFVQFWIETINEWEQETGSKAITGLSAPKDVQDSILLEPALAAIVDLIDIRYWHYQADGTLYAPAGNKQLAPRQHARLLKPKKTSFEQVYRAVSEYRKKFPSKAVTYSGEGYDQFGWAVFMGGGSLPHLPKTLPTDFLELASSMTPDDVENAQRDLWMLSNTNGERIIYSRKPAFDLDMRKSKGTYRLQWLNPATGGLVGLPVRFVGGEKIELKPPTGDAGVAWIMKGKN